MAALAGQRILVIGDDNAALEFALRLAPLAHVTLMHRRDEFRAATDTVDRLRRLRSEGALSFVAAQPSGICQAEGRLTALRVLGADGQTRPVALDTLFVLTGLSPKLGPDRPIGDWRSIANNWWSTPPTSRPASREFSR